MKMRAKKVFAGILSAAMGLSFMTILPCGNVSAAALVENGFETDYEGWTNLGVQTKLTATAAAAHDSLRGMAVTNRLNAADGAYSEKGFYLAGGIRYSYSVFVKADTAEDYSMTLTWRYADNSTESAVIAATSAAAGEWTKLSGSYTAPDGTVNLTVSLTTATANDFYFDDFKADGAVKRWTKAEINAAAAEYGLKDIFANYFRVGCCLPGEGVDNSTMKGIVLREFNSVTCENELKPDSTLVQNGSTDDNIQVSLSSAAGIIDFCIKNNIAMRGHTLVWHSQTPDWFFKLNFSNYGSWVDSSTMDRRMESYIKNMFSAIATQYPSLNLYAYDVCNECISDNGGPRTAGSNNEVSGNSAWVKVYGDNSFIKKAFTYARKYAPDGCKLFYNDYNEYMGQKYTDICALLNELKSAGLIDGMGMQSHLGSSYPSLDLYRTALEKFASIVGCVHITELDIEGADATRYAGIMQIAMDNADSVEAFVVWGTIDSKSWRSDKSPLLFDSSGNKKAAYNSIAALVDPSNYGDGDNPSGGSITPVVIEPDEDGCYFHCTFESGTESWSTRGSDSVSQTNQTAYLGNGSLFVSNRTDAWNGTGRSLSSNPFKPGETFSFGAVVMHESENEEEEIKLTLQYDGSDGEPHYDQVALVTAKKGEWTLISNNSYTIPEGATGMLLYLETPDSLIDFYVDEAYGGIENAAPVTVAVSTTEPVVTDYMRGDVDANGTVALADAIMLDKSLAGGSEFTLSAAGRLNADVDKSGTVDSTDLSILLDILLGVQNI